MKIHPSAVINSAAILGRDVEVGPFCVIESDTIIGNGCKLASRVVVRSGTELGRDNQIFEGAVLGGLPQHINMPESPGKLVIGSGNTIRENVTVHRSLGEDETTVIGDNNLLMVNVHIAHDCRLGNNTIFANNSMLAGHVTINDRAYVSGAVGIHQFCRVGTLAMVGGQAHVVKDVPPYVTVDGSSGFVVGLNQIGLRRAGFSPSDVRQLKEAYRVIYRNGLSWNDILAQLKESYANGPAARFHEFLSNTTRGIIGERRLPPGATIKLRREADEEPTLRVRAG